MPPAENCVAISSLHPRESPKHHMGTKAVCVFFLTLSFLHLSPSPPVRLSYRWLIVNYSLFPAPRKLFSNMRPVYHPQPTSRTEDHRPLSDERNEGALRANALTYRRIGPHPKFSRHHRAINIAGASQAGDVIERECRLRSSANFTVPVVTANNGAMKRGV